MRKVSLTLWLAVIILLGWTAFNAAQAAPGQRFNQRSDAHYRSAGNVPPSDYGSREVRHLRPYPNRHYVPIRNHYPYRGYHNAHRLLPVNWLFVPPLPNPFHRNGGY
jgi:hypothetical protein